MGLLGQMTVQFNADTTGLLSGLAAAKSAIADLVSTPVGAAIAGIAAIGSAAVALGASSVSAAADFQGSMTKVIAYAGLSKQQADAMSQSIMQMSTEVGQAPAALANALYPIVSSGYAASDALNVLKLSAETAAASGADTTTVAQGLTTTLKAFSLPASQASNVMDILNKTVSNGNMTFPTLASSIGKLAQTSSSAHVPLTQMGAALDVLSTHGFPSTAQASTALQNLFTQLSIKTDALQQHANQLGLKGFNATAFQAMDLGQKIQYLNQVTDGNQASLLKMLGGSKNALQAFTALSNGTADYNTALKSLNASQGTTAQVFATASNTFGMSIQKMSAAFDVLKINIGNALLPVLNNLMGFITPLIQRFASWVQSSNVLQNAISALGGWFNNLKNYLSPLVPIIVSTIAQFINWTQNSNTLQNTISILGTIINNFRNFLAPVIPFISNIIQQFISWMQNSNILGNAIEGLGGWINRLLSLILPLQGIITNSITLFVSWVQSSNILQNAISLLGMIFNGLMQLLAPLGNLIVGLTNFFIQLGTTINSNNPVFIFLGTLIQNIGSMLASMFLPLWNTLVQTFQTQIIPAWNSLIAAIQPIMPTIINVAEVIGGTLFVMFTALMGIIGAVIGAFVGLETGIVRAWGGIIQIFSGAIQFITGIITFFIDLTTGQYDRLGNDLGAIWSGIVQMFYGVWNTIAAIFDAGINLVIGLINGFIAGALGPINAMLAAIHQAPIAIGQIPMIKTPPPPGQPAAPVYKSPVAAASNQTSTAAQATRNQTSTASIMSQLNSFIQPSQQASTNIAAPAAPATNFATLGASTPVTSAVNNASSAITKKQDAANAQALRLAAEQQKALQASSSSAVQQLVNQSKAAAASGQTSTAQFYAQQATSLANQQKAQATRTTNAAAAATRHQKTLAAAADRKAQAAKNHQAAQAAAAQRHQQALAAAAARHSQAQASRSKISSAVTSTKTTTGVASTVIPTTSSGITVPTTTGTTSAAAPAQPLTIIIEFDGKQLMQWVGDTTAKTVRLKTGRRH